MAVSVATDDAATFSDVCRCGSTAFQEFRRELARIAATEGPGGARREWGDNDADRSVRKALNEDLDKTRRTLCRRVRSASTPRILTAASTAPRLVIEPVRGFGRRCWRLRRGHRRAGRAASRAPLNEITEVTEAVAARRSSTQRCRSRRAATRSARCARSIAVFQRRDAPQRRAQPDRARRSAGALAPAGRHDRPRSTASRARSRRRSPSLAASPTRCSAPRGSCPPPPATRASRTARAARSLERSLRQCARHCVGRRRAVGVGQRDRPPGRAIERDREQGGRGGRADQRRGQRSSTRRRGASATSSS